MLKVFTFIYDYVIHLKRIPINAALRHEAFVRDGYRCLECGASNQDTSLEVDHIIPVSQGGTDELQSTNIMHAM